MLKRVAQIIVIGYIAFTVLIAILFYVTNAMPPHKILQEESQCIDGLPPITVIDMDRPYNTLYILDINRTIYKVDPYKRKLLATYHLNHLHDLQGLSVYDDGYDHFLYVSDHTSVHRAKVTTNDVSVSLRPEKVLDGLQNPKDIFVYFEYQYTPHESKRVETLAVLEGDIDKINIYDVRTKELLESKKAKLDIQEHRTTVATVAMQNVPYYVKSWDSEQGIKTRQYLNHIRLYTNRNSFSTELGKITHTRHGNYIIPDQKNNLLWVYDNFGLYDWDYIKLEKSPYMAFTFPYTAPDFVNGDALLSGKGNFRTYIQYTDDKGLICATVTDTLYGKVKSMIDRLFKIFVAPFFFFALMFVGKVG